ncbi:hypothetical protein OAQ56_02070 [Alphaproteobacteria bacterium]|nr:hypothetical protein [Alphaproteobacteria bacterium]
MAINSNFSTLSIENTDISPDGLNRYIHASAARANLIKEMAKRALQEII